MDPMTLMMLQALSRGQGQGQATAAPAPSGPYGQVQQAPQTTPMTGINNAIAPLQQALLIRALRAKMPQQPPGPNMQSAGAGDVPMG